MSFLHSVTDLTTVPSGRYVVRVVEVRHGLARNGSEAWSLRLEVAEGEYQGRTACWARLHWSEAAWGESRAVLRAFGVEASPLNIMPQDLIGLRATVAVEVSKGRTMHSDQLILLNAVLSHSWKAVQP